MLQLLLPYNFHHLLPTAKAAARPLLSFLGWIGARDSIVALGVTRGVVLQLGLGLCSCGAAMPAASSSTNLCGVKCEPGRFLFSKSKQGERGQVGRCRKLGSAVVLNLKSAQG